MGRYRIEIQAVGGHGCQREVKDGATITDRCGNASCPDCLARSFVEDLRALGENVEGAKLIHWPDEPSQVIDDLVTGVRQGSF